MGETELAPETAAALLATICASSGRPDLRYVGAPRALHGGFDAELVGFELDGAPAELRGPLVARIVSSPAVARWEAVLQGGAAAQGFPTPAVRLVADETSPLGRALLVMDHVDGRPMLAGLDGARIVGQIPKVVRDLPDVLARLAASLHALDATEVDAELTDLPDGIPTTATGFLEAQWWMAMGSDRPDLAEVAERLVATEPPSRRRCITHGDLHPFNVLAAARGPVLIDWTVARVGHPGFTLGFTDLVLSNPPLAVPGPLRPGVRSLGRHLARRFHRTYRSLAAPADHVTDDELAWFTAVHGLRILVELAQFEGEGGVPPGHPWSILGPVVEPQLGLVRSG
jgi:aminoglycoside phosphotransferase (APT) family kinase protein